MSELETPTPDRPRFLCDAMLGSLARWLRFFGCDALYFQPGMPDDVVADAARAEGRWLLTRDRRLAAVGPRALLVRADSLDGQLVEVFSRLGLQPAANLERSRCGECNGTLKEVTREEVLNVAPPHVLATALRFWCCTGCSRIYWRGSHSARIIARMQSIIQRLNV